MIELLQGHTNDSCRSLKMRMTVCWEGTAFKYWKNCLKHCLIFRVPLLSCGWVDVRFRPYSLQFPCPHHCLRCHRWWLFHGHRESHLRRGFPWRAGPRSFDENSRKAVKEEKIKSAALSALVSADPPWESLWDHNTSHKNSGSPASRLKRTFLSLEWGSTELEKGKSGGKRKVSHMHRLNEGLSGQTYRIGAGMVEWELVCGEWRKGGVLVGHYMKPKYNTSLSFSHCWRFTSLLCLPLAPYGFS